LRCQRTTVSGFTMTRDLRQELQIRESKTQKSRSAIRISGRLFVLFITVNCWRSTRFSAARFEVILIFDNMNETRLPSVFFMIIAWQAHENLSIISGSMNICEGGNMSEVTYWSTIKGRNLRVMQYPPSWVDMRIWMSREIHVWNCESLGVRFPRATRLS
jgi:hypothetical protein